jgi:hypothetical protein
VFFLDNALLLTKLFLMFNTKGKRVFPEGGPLSAYTTLKMKMNTTFWSKYPRTIQSYFQLNNSQFPFQTLGETLTLSPSRGRRIVECSMQADSRPIGVK